MGGMSYRTEGMSDPGERERERETYRQTERWRDRDPQRDWLRPTHTREGSLLYSESIDLNVNDI